MMYIDRVKEVNPYINAVVEDRYNAALDEAKAVDTKIAEARSSGVIEELVRGKPLLGVPFTVKESCSLGGEFLMKCYDMISIQLFIQG